MTVEELALEITEGPLAQEFVPYWGGVFNDPEPLRTKLIARQGQLKPDAAAEILKILEDPTRREYQVQRVSRGSFIAAVSPLSIAVSQLPEAKQKYWTLILTLLTGGDDEVDVGRPEIGLLMDAAIVDGLLTVQQKEAIVQMGGTSTRSRLEELGWIGVNLNMIQKAKEVA